MSLPIVRLHKFNTASDLFWEFMFLVFKNVCSARVEVLVFLSRGEELVAGHLGKILEDLKLVPPCSLFWPLTMIIILAPVILTN